MKIDKKEQGFTLLELMVTVSIAIILTAIAAPSFTSLLRDSRMTATANDLLTALNYTRSEAITRGVQVTMLKQGGAASVWDGGWQVFSDFDGDGVLDGGDGDALLKVHEPMSANSTLRTGGTFASWVSYQPNGLVEGSAGVGGDTFRLCDANADVASSRRIVINTVGRARVDTVAAACP